MVEVKRAIIAVLEEWRIILVVVVILYGVTVIERALLKAQPSSESYSYELGAIEGTLDSKLSAIDMSLERLASELSSIKDALDGIGSEINAVRRAMPIR